MFWVSDFLFLINNIIFILINDQSNGHALGIRFDRAEASDLKVEVKVYTYRFCQFRSNIL